MLPILPHGYGTRSFSKIDEEDIRQLSGVEFPAFFFHQRKFLDGDAGILVDLVQGQGLPQCQDAEINDISHRAQDLQKRCTFSFYKSEMSRRALVGEVVTYGIKVAETFANTMVVYGEEIEYDVAPIGGVSRGVAIRKPSEKNAAFVLSGPMDYLLLSVNTNQAIANKGHNAWARALQHLKDARVTLCPIEVKAVFGGPSELFKSGICQAWAQAFVVGEAWGPIDYRPFVLTDGNSWIFGIMKKGQNPGWFFTIIEWRSDADQLKLIVQTLVCWLCFSSTQVYQCIENRKNADNVADFDRKHYFGWRS